MTEKYTQWLNEVRSALASVNMPIDDWQKTWIFDFEREFREGTTSAEAAAKANRFWWSKQNGALGQQCAKTKNCWLPRNHTGDCQPV